MMDLAASKSTTKSRNPNPASSLKDYPQGNPSSPARRSRSVSAVSRSSDVSHFSNTRDNPLYCCSSSSSSSSSPDPESKETVGSGRDASAHHPPRSLSRTGSGKRRLRSVSNQHYGNSESELERGYRSASSTGSKAMQPGASTNKLDDSEETRSLRKWTDQHPVPECWETSSARNWGDRISTSSFSEAEDMVIRAPILRSDPPINNDGADGIYETVRSEVRRAVSEIRNDLENVIRRKSPAAVATKNATGFPQRLMSTEAFEFVSDIRMEYATKLEQSQERARKLRADLAIEEQRGQELSKILEEMVPAKSPRTHKPRPRRKASIERLKMSRRLAEEAMNYFDECVSISTFDSSDFSSIEDPQHGLAVDVPPMSSSRFFQTETSASSASHTAAARHNYHEESDYLTPCSLSIAGSDLAISSTCSGGKAANLMHDNGSHDDLVDFEMLHNGNLQFTREPMETAGANDIRHYIKKLGKEFRKESVGCAKIRSSYNAEDYDATWPAESLFFDRVIYRNRIESGGLLLCHFRIF